MKKTKTKCYLYTRVSTSMQVDGYSLDAQRDKLRKYAEYEDMVVAGEYSDEGFSGKNIQGRHEFQRMLQDIQDCKDGVEYVLVFKLSRFGRNAADVLNSLQLMQDFGVNLICVEDGIDSSKDSGKLMISVLSAVAEIERENIRTQTMAGREQKAREGKWNGGFAPYGYRLEKGELLIAEDEVDVIRTIFDRYIHTNDGVSGVAKYLNRQGFVKKLRQNGTIPGFSASFVKSIIDNPVYMGKIAYGRRRTEKKIGTRNEMHVVEQSEFPVYEGKHEAIISEEDWNLAQEKRKINAYRREKVNDPTHAHILSGILKCPCCGKSLYGNIAKAHSKDKKTRYYYYCKNTVTPTGHECTFRLNIEQMEMNRMVASIISAMVSDPRFADAIKAKIGSAVDTNDLEKQLEALQAQLRQTLGTKARLERQMDGLDVNDPYYDRKISDLQRRYDEQYGAIDEIEVQIDDVQSQIRSIRQEKISGDNIYRLLLAFDQVYEAASEVERKEFMRAFIERIELFPEKQPDGNWIRKIIFNFPVPVNGTEVKELPLENETIVETVVLLSRETINDHTIGNLNLSNNQQTVMETDAKRRIAGKFTDNRPMTDGLKTDALSKFRIYKEKLKCSFLGDSITEGINTTKTYHEYLAELCGIEARNFGANGSCISTYTLDASLHYYCMVERVETVDKDSDMVFVFGGTNDFNRGCPMGTFESKDKNTFKGALSVMLQYLKDHFPNKKIYLLTPIRRGIFDSQPTDLQANSIGLYLTDYVDAIKEAGELFDIEVIDLHTLTGLNPNDKECADQYFHNSGSIDNLHPNAKGHLVIAETICRHLLKA